MCLNGLRCSQNAGKLHSESTKFQIFLGEHAPQPPPPPPVKLEQITHVKSSPACRGDGSKLPPYVVLKRKTFPKKMVFSPSVIVLCQGKGWMNEEMVKDWIKTVWSKVGGLSRERSLLVFNLFRAHLSNPVRRASKTVNS